MEPDVAVVIPVVNCLTYTRQAVGSIYPRGRLYLIDNGSTDGTQAWAESRADDHFVYLRQERNLGVAASWNLGLRRAFDDGYGLVLVANNDVVFAPDTLPALRAWAVETEGFITVHAVPSLGFLERLPREHRLDQPLDFCAFLINPVIVGRVGWFDEAYWPAYFEDCDYQKRMEQAGVRMGRAMDAVACHYWSRTIREGGVKNAPYFEQNQRRFMTKWGHLQGRT